MIIKLINITLKIIPLIAVVLICLQIFISNELAGLGQEVQATDNQIYNLREENEALNQQIASASSLATITDLAKKQGFTETPNYIVIGREEFALQPLR